MASIASDIVGGFNTFLSEQMAHPTGGRITLVQFDSQDPFEILIDGEDLSTVKTLDPARYVPRDMTPLNDAAGKMIARIDKNILTRADRGEPIEDQIVLIISDGLENASREFDGRTVAGLIEERRARGWVFTFLGVEEGTYAAGAAMQLAQANIDRWDRTSEGSHELFDKLSRASTRYRSSSPKEKWEWTDKFLEEDEA
jgi:hypothetical protein